MKFWPILLLALLWPAALYADELILKDGKNISWKSMTDDGATLTVVTTDGKKLTIRKEEVDKIVIQPSKDTPPTVLTGASITFDKKKKLEIVDLLAMIDPKRDGKIGRASCRERV